MKKQRVILYTSLMITGFVLFAFVIGVSCTGNRSDELPNVENAEKILENDGELLKIVVKYLENSEEVEYIHKTALRDDKEAIEDEKVIEAINELFNRKYDAITKDENTICFQRWTRLKDFGAGVAYSINGVDEPKIDYVIKIEPLSKEQWYYYEEN